MRILAILVFTCASAALIAQAKAAASSPVETKATPASKNPESSTPAPAKTACPAATRDYLAAVGVTLAPGKFKTARHFSLRENEKAKTVGPVELYCLRNLEVLDLSFTRIPAESWPDFRRFRKLRHLSLAGNEIPDDLLRNLAATRIENLNISFSSVSPLALALIKDMPLKRLQLSNSPACASSGLDYIKDMRGLEEVRLSMCDLSGDSLTLLAGLPALKRVAVRGSLISTQALKKLREMRPDLIIEH